MLEALNSISNLELSFFVNSQSETQQKITALKREIADTQPDLVHFEWIHDIEEVIVEISSLLNAQGILWTSVGSFSRALRKYEKPSLENSANVELIRKLSLAHECGTLKSILIFDNFLVDRFQDKYPFLVHLPDSQNTEMRKKCDFCVSKKENSRPTIGVLGNLLGYRGCENLIQYWRTSKSFNLMLAGPYFKHSISFATRCILFLSKLDRRNIFLLEYIEDEGLLNHLITHLDALYIDTSNYKEPSGIALKVLALGKKVVIENSDSFLNESAQKLKNIILIEKKSLATIDLQIKFESFSGLSPANSKISTLNSFSSAWLRNA